MTKIEALTMIAQTVMRSRNPKIGLNSNNRADLGLIARTVAECAPLVNANCSDENAAIIELAKRYNLDWPVQANRKENA